MTDFYDILGIDRKADSSDIKAAFKRLAMQFHPDRNPGDILAEEQFKKINEAYHVLSDPLKKSKYDTRYFSYNTTATHTEHYWRNLQQRRYYQWKKQQRTTYRFDRNYFKIQGLAFLVFIILSGFCFLVIHATYFFIEKHQAQVYRENSLLLKKVNGLFTAGKVREAFSMVNNLYQKDPIEYRFSFAYDSLVNALRATADNEFVEKKYTTAVTHYRMLNDYEKPNRSQTFQRIASCEYLLGNYEQSLLALKKMYSQQSWNLELIYEIGLLNLEKLNNKEEALAYFTLGKTKFKQNLRAVYGKAFEFVMDPKDAPDVYYNLFEARARVNLDLRHYQEAVTDCNWAIFLRPLESEPYRLRVLAKIKTGEVKYLCDDIEKAMLRGSKSVKFLQDKYCR